MTHSVFDRFQKKLSQNVYGSLKGHIRLMLLEKDIGEFCGGFHEKRLSILDVGCGEGAFAGRCLWAGHSVVLLDDSPKMIDAAQRHIKNQMGDTALDRAHFVHADFLQWEQANCLSFDIVLVHGSAEWMVNACDAIDRAIGLVKTGGYLSLLMFNRDVHLFKKGINGHLCGDVPSKKQKLIPPNAQSITETVERLHQHPGKIVLQSGIRIFHGFFRAIDISAVSAEMWLEQETNYYRRLPFSMLGQHTHFIWQKAN